jgi:hypothetical protein
MTVEDYLKPKVAIQYFLTVQALLPKGNFGSNPVIRLK